MSGHGVAVAAAVFCCAIQVCFCWWALNRHKYLTFCRLIIAVAHCINIAYSAEIRYDKLFRVFRMFVLFFIKSFHTQVESIVLLILLHACWLHNILLSRCLRFKCSFHCYLFELLFIHFNIYSLISTSNVTFFYWSRVNSTIVLKRNCIRNSFIDALDRYGLHVKKNTQTKKCAGCSRCHTAGISWMEKNLCHNNEIDRISPIFIGKLRTGFSLELSKIASWT